MEYLKPELDVVAEAQELILGLKVIGEHDNEQDPPGQNKPEGIVGLDD
jgi:hypothetical protein